MKTLMVFCLALITFGSAHAQFNRSFTMNYGFALPTGGMKQYIQYGNGAVLAYMLQAPSSRLAFGLEVGITGYGRSKTSQDYEFADGTTAPMDVIVNNTYTTVMAVTRLYLIQNGPVRPYASVRAGYTFFRTQLGIYDPDISDSCEPVESNLLSKDQTFAYSAGGGLTIDAGWLFKKAKPGRWFIDISSNILQGGRVNYMNEDPPDMNNTHRNTRAKEVEARFINTETQVVHDHHVGYMYNSFVQMVDFRLGLKINLN